MLTRKRLTLIVLIFVCFTGSLPWYSFSAVLDYIARDINLQSSDISLILSSFQAGYVIIVIIIGWLADRFGPKRVITINIFLAGLFSYLFALFSTGTNDLMIFRALTGAASGSIYTIGLVLLSQWFPDKRGNVMGAFTAAFIASFAFTYLFSSHLSDEYGWRVAVLITTGPAFIGFFVSLIFVKDAPTLLSNIAHNHHKSKSNRKLNIAILLIILSYTGHMWELFSFYGWIGPFLVSVFSAKGRNLAEANISGGAFAALVIIMGAPSSWLWGHFADRIGYVLSICISSVASAFLITLIGFLYDNEIWTIMLVGIFLGFWIVSDTAIYKALLSSIVPQKELGIYLGVLSAAGFGITVISPIVFGEILTYYNGSLTIESKTWWPSFATLGSGSIFAVGMILIFNSIQNSAKELFTLNKYKLINKN